MTSLAARLLALFLAAVPAAWGTCPSWVYDEGVRASLSTSARACPCCAEEPVPETKGPFDRRHRGCDGCPVVDVRHASALAPAVVALPPTDVAYAVAVLPPSVAAGPAPSRAGVRAARAADPGGPPPLVGTVVLLI